MLLSIVVCKTFTREYLLGALERMICPERVGNCQTYPMCEPMVLEYLPTKLGHFGGVNVAKNSSTMEHMGDSLPEGISLLKPFKTQITVQCIGVFFMVMLPEGNGRE